MRRRLYFLLPDIEHCQKLVYELKQGGMSDDDIHAIARQDIPLQGINEATALQKTELSHGLELGVGVGGIAGMLGGLLAVTFPPAGLVIGGGALLILATTLAGAGFGSIVSMLVASDIPNHELDNFQVGISQGHILLMLDVPTSEVAAMTDLIKSHHPEAEVGITKAAPKAA